MKFIHYLEDITGIGVYPMVSLIIFVVFFAFVTLWVFKADRKYIEHMKKSPLDQESNA